MPYDIEIVTSGDYCTNVEEHFSYVPEVAKPLLRNAKAALSKIEEMLYSALTIVTKGRINLKK